MWFTESTEDEFLLRSQCYIEQYNNYSLEAGPVGTIHTDFVRLFPTLQVNGTQTLGENIADNGGLAIAFQVIMSMGSSYVQTSQLGC